MRNSDKQEIKKKIGRIGLFMLIVFVPILVIEVLLYYAGVSQWVNIMILVLIMVILFLLYSYILMKLDQRKAERMKKKKDPFSD